MPLCHFCLLASCVAMLKSSVYFELLCTHTHTRTHTHTHTAHIQSLGETHVDLSPAAALPPVPPLAGESHDSSHDPQTISVVSHVHDPQGGSQLVLKDGDIRDDVIEDIVAQATSSSSSSEDEAEDTTGESHLQTKIYTYHLVGSGQFHPIVLASFPGQQWKACRK